MPDFKTLLILRHAKAEPAESHQTDHQRPLAERGRLEAPQVGRWIAEQGLVPGVILSSTALRARETTVAVVAAMPFAGEVHYSDSLYLAGPGSYLSLIREQPSQLQTIMVVGHNPGLEDLVRALTGEVHPLPTAALAVVHVKLAGWEELTLDQHSALERILRLRELRG